MDDLKFLENWFQENCNDDWEHSHGVNISTLDNPGWCVIVDLDGTPSENIVFETVKAERTEKDWIICKVENKKFIGVGGGGNLSEILEVLKKCF